MNSFISFRNSFKILILIFVLISCSNRNNIELNDKKNDLQKMNLKGDIIMIGDANVVDGKGLFTYTFFNEEGNVSKLYRSLDTYKKYEINYYENHKLIKTTSLSFFEPWNDFNENTDIYEYQDDVLIKKVSVGESNGEPVKITNFYVANKNNEIIYTDEIRSYKVGTKNEYSNKDEIYSFYENRNKIKDSIINYSNDTKNKSTSIKIYKYDVNGNLIEEKWSGKEDNKYWYKKTFKNGLEVEFQNNEQTKYFEYKYDLNGNWIEKREKSKKEPSFIRTIIYRGQDLNKFENEYDQTVIALTKTRNKNKFSGNNDSSEEPFVQNNINDFSQNNANSDNQGSVNQKRICTRCGGDGRCDKCNRNQKVFYHDENGSLNSRSEIKLGYVVCQTCLGVGYSGGGKSISGWNKISKCLNYCSNGWDECNNCNEYGRGKYLGGCKNCNGTGYLN